MTRKPVSLWLALSLLAVGAASSPASRAKASSTRPGTVQTLAGPGFCSGVTVVDREESSLWALGVDAQGITYADVGSSGRVRKADAFGTVFVPTGLPARKSRDRAPGDGVPVAGRLAPDGNGGFFLSAGQKILRLAAPRTAAQNVGINPGTISLETFAGDPASAPGRPGAVSSGDGGPFREARFISVRSLTTDPAGNVYLADRMAEGAQRFRVRFINRSSGVRVFYPGTADELSVAPGTIGTIAGATAEGDVADAPSALRAGLRGEPPSLAVQADRLYLGLSLEGPGDVMRTSVRMINLGGQPVRAHGISVDAASVATVAGGGRAGFGGDGGASPQGRFSELPGIAADAAGNLLVADRGNHRIRKIDSGGLLTTFAGSASPSGGYNGHGVQAEKALLKSPFDVKFGPQGEVFISDQGNGLLRVVNSRGIIEPAPGNASAWKCKDPTDEKSPSNETPRAGNLSGVAVAPGGTVFFSDRGGSRIRKVAAPGTVEPAANPSGSPSLRRASAGPAAIAAGPRGGIYVLRSTIGGLVLFNPTTRPLAAMGKKMAPGAAREVVPPVPVGEAGSSRGIPPAGLEAAALTVDRAGNVYVVQGTRQGVSLVTPKGELKTVAGPGAAGSVAQCCLRPAGVAADPAGNLYVSDPGTSRIWFINRGRSPIRIQGGTAPPNAAIAVGGNGSSGISGEGVKAVETPLQRPGPIAVDRKGNVFFGEGGAHTVRRIDPSGMLTTVVGSGNPGFNGEGLRGKLTLLTDPVALAVDHCGNLLMADRGNDMIRRLDVVGDCAARPAPAADGGDPSTGPQSPFPLVPILAAAILIFAGTAFLVYRRRKRS